jgi:cell division GTPase FtsZ
MTTERQPQTTSSVAANSTIKVFGVGRAGQRVLEETLALGLQGASFIAVNSDARRVHRRGENSLQSAAALIRSGWPCLQRTVRAAGPADKCAWREGR